MILCKAYNSCIVIHLSCQIGIQTEHQDIFRIFFNHILKLNINIGVLSILHNSSFFHCRIFNQSFTVESSQFKFSSHNIISIISDVNGYFSVTANRSDGISHIFRIHLCLISKQLIDFYNRIRVIARHSIKSDGWKCWLSHYNFFFLHFFSV